MNLDSILQQVMSFAGTFNPALAALLFAMCSVGEFGISVPYVLETIWLLSGYNAGTGVLPFHHLLLLWLVSHLGRQSGAALLYYLSRFGTLPLVRLYRKRFQTGVSAKLSENKGIASRLFRRINQPSPFAVASGRLFWLRIPLTLTLGAKRQYRTLALGVLLSSLIWDSLYISLGAVLGVNVVVKPPQMILYSLAGLTVLYMASLVVGRVIRLRPSGSKTG